MKVLWKNGVPYSEIFQDLYYSRYGGLAEAKYIFIKGNELDKRWKSCISSALYPDLLLDTVPSEFFICELGFGTALNFLLTAQKFLLSAPPSSHLYFISCEKYPMSFSQIEKSLASFSEVSKYFCYSSFLEFYKKKTEEQDKEEILNWSFQNRIHLKLYFIDVKKMLKDILSKKYKIDAWYLDGFSPKKNPEMWEEKIYSYMAKLSKKGSTFASFSVASSVKKGLTMNGFFQKRSQGFENKKHMLSGFFI